MANEKYKYILIGMFGRKAGLKLYNWLYGCCDTFCEDVQACISESEGLNLPEGDAENLPLSFGEEGNGFYSDTDELHIVVEETDVAFFDSSSFHVDAIFDATGNGINIEDVTVNAGGITNQNGSLAGFYAIGAEQSLSGNGAISLAGYHTKFTSTATGNTLSLSSSPNPGQLKKITYVAEGAGSDTGILTLPGYTSITFNGVGNYVLLISDGSVWIAVESSGVTIV